MEENVNNEPRKAKNLFYRLLSFEGRARRSEYWLVTLVLTLLMVPALIAEIIGEEYPEYALFAAVYILVLLIPIIYLNLAVSVRRLHDLGINGWFVLLGSVPLLNIVFNVYIAFFKGKDEDNKYGPSPY